MSGQRKLELAVEWNFKPMVIRTTNNDHFMASEPRGSPLRHRGVASGGASCRLAKPGCWDEELHLETGAVWSLAPAAAEDQQTRTGRGRTSDVIDSRIARWKLEIAPSTKTELSQAAK